MPSTSQIADILYKKLLGLGTTNSGRKFFEEPILGRPFVVPNQVWQQTDLIPNSAPSVTAGVVQRVTGYTLATVVGTTNAFSGSLLVDAIPFNWGDGTSYNYTVYDSTITQISFGVNDWTIDTEAGILMFNSGVPNNMPPKISFWRYSGQKGFTGTFITTGQTGSFVTTSQTGSFVTNNQTGNFLTTGQTGQFITGASNLGGGSGIFSGVISGQLYLKSLKAGQNIRVDGTSNDLTVGTTSSVGFDAVALNTLDCQVSAIITGVQIATLTEINLISGVNLGNASGIFAGKAGYNSQFKSLSGGSGVRITGDGNTLVFTVTGIQGGSSSGESNTASNLGGGSGLFAQKAGVDLQFKSLTTDSNLEISGTSTELQIGLKDEIFVSGLNSTGYFSFNSGITPIIYYQSGDAFAMGVADTTISFSPNREIIGFMTIKSSTKNAEIVFDDNNNTYFSNEPYVSGFRIDSPSLKTAGQIVITGADNIGTGHGVYSGALSTKLRFKNVSGGSGVRITSFSDTLLFEVTGITGGVSSGGVGTITTGLSVGTGIPIFSGVSGNALLFNSITGVGNLSAFKTGQTISIKLNDVIYSNDLGASIGLSNKSIDQFDFNNNILQAGSISLTINDNNIGAVSPLSYQEGFQFVLVSSGSNGIISLYHEIPYVTGFNILGAPIIQGTNISGDNIFQSGQRVVTTAQTGTLINAGMTGSFVTKNAPNFNTGYVNFAISNNRISGNSGFMYTGNRVRVSGEVDAFSYLISGNPIPTGAQNLGPNSGVFSGIFGNQLYFKTLTGASGINISGDGNTLHFTVTGIVGGGTSFTYSPYQARFYV